MSATSTVIPGYQFGPTEKVTIAKLNLLGQPTIPISVNIGQVDDVTLLSETAMVFATPAPAQAGDYLQLIDPHNLVDPATIYDVQRVYFTTTGTLPTNLTAETYFSYYVRGTGTPARVYVYRTAYDCFHDQNRIDIVDAGTGTHTMHWTVLSIGEPLTKPTGADWQNGIVRPQNMAEMVGATATVNGARGAVPQPLFTDYGKFLSASGQWSTPSFTSNDLFNYLHY